VTAPYYQDEQVTLYHGDCRELTAWLEADVLVTDPPYGMAFVSGFRTRTPSAGLIEGDSDTTVRDRALYVWGPERPGIVFGTWRAAAPLGERQRLIWAKGGTPGMGDLRMPWGPGHEEIHVIGSGWDREQAGVKRRGSVIETKVARGSASGAEVTYGHPTPKPVSLMETLINACPPGVIADPFAGSGSTLVAARNLGRRAIGVELEERYCEVIARRLAQDCLPLGGVS
jgi:site-specific DNA-methyltransferase (adenine-specific)